MGQCGCKDFHPNYVMPGPDGSVYALQLDPGCPYCDDHKVGMMVQKLSGQAVEDWETDYLPQLPLKPIDGNNHQEAVFLVVNPDHLAEHLLQFLRADHGLETFDDDLAVEEFHKEVRAALREAVFRSRKDAQKEDMA